jgi:tRNA pseudouridine32 synthase / 23S rRNA pseudouridine746 synthase
MTQSIQHIDNDLIVCVKPLGLLAVPGRGTDKQDCLSARLAAEFGEIHIVHRLDQATSGLMVFARNVVTMKALNLQFSERTVDKAYEAIVVGKPHSESFSIELPLMADWPNRPKQKVAHGDDLALGKASLTHVTVMWFDAATNTSRVRLVPVTGRTHQLRVHLSAVGHGIVGDQLYTHPDNANALQAAPRLMLHAIQLGLTQPTTGDRLVFESAPDF